MGNGLCLMVNVAPFTAAYPLLRVVLGITNIEQGMVPYCYVNVD